MKSQTAAVELPVTSDTNVMGGAPVFRGTRVPLQTLFDYLVDGYTLDQFLDSFPSVRREDVLTVVEAAGQSLAAGAVQR